MQPDSVKGSGMRTPRWTVALTAVTHVKQGAVIITQAPDLIRLLSDIIYLTAK